MIENGRRMPVNLKASFNYRDTLVLFELLPTPPSAKGQNRWTADAFGVMSRDWREAEEDIMGVEQAPTTKGKQAAKGLKQAAAKDERKTEAETGRPLKKGAARFEERSKSSDGKSAGAKQKN